MNRKEFVEHLIHKACGERKTHNNGRSEEVGKNLEEMKEKNTAFNGLATELGLEQV